LVLAGIAIGACAQQLRPSLLAHAGTGADHRCDYTFIRDTNDPNIGEVGNVTYDADWEKVLSAGWTLKTIHSGGPPSANVV
jgi:hypothetical protein